MNILDHGARDASTAEWKKTNEDWRYCQGRLKRAIQQT